jgi:phosphoribosylformylglycinamidine synthase
MTKPKALVICGDGINCDLETAFALDLAGFESARLHVSDFLNRPLALNEAKLLAIPGGFSFGDEIASGKVLSLKIKQTLSDTLHRFIDSGNLLLGICNGFQVLVQMGLLPFSEYRAPRVVSLARNSGGKFINRWTELSVDHNTPGNFFDSLDTLQLPIRHGEGRLALGSQSDEHTCQTVKQHAPLRYKDDVNGSYDRIAALCNTTGNVLGLMPHPEAFVRWTQNPDWRREKPAKTEKGKTEPDKNEPHGLIILRNAARMAGAQ